VLNSNYWRLSVLLLTAFFTLESGDVRAGLFGRKNHARQAKDVASSAAPITQVSASDANWEPTTTVPVTRPVEIVAETPLAAYDESDWPAPAMKMCGERTFGCFNCGQDDRCQSCERQCRKRCKQTWYPRVAPYCQSGWGWNQPCWRRAQDTTICPSWQTPSATAVPVPAPEEPATEPSSASSFPQLRQSGPRR